MSTNVNPILTDKELLSASQSGGKASNQATLLPDRREPMGVDLNGHECRSCGGPLEILATKRGRVDVECRHCGDIYSVAVDRPESRGVVIPLSRTAPALPSEAQR